MADRQASRRERRVEASCELPLGDLLLMALAAVAATPPPPSLGRVSRAPTPPPPCLYPHPSAMLAATCHTPLALANAQVLPHTDTDTDTDRDRGVGGGREGTGGERSTRPHSFDPRRMPCHVFIMLSV